MPIPIERQKIPIGNDDAEVSLREYWEIIRRHNLVVISMALLIFIISLIFTAMQPNMYEVNLELERNQTKIKNMRALPFMIDDPSQSEVVFQALENPNTIESAIKKLPQTLNTLAQKYTVTDEDKTLILQVTSQSLKHAVGYEFVDEKNQFLKLTIKYHDSAIVTTAIALAIAQATDESLRDKVKSANDNELAILQELKTSKQKEISNLNQKILTQRRGMSIESQSGIVVNDEPQLRSLNFKLESDHRKAKLKLRLNTEELSVIKSQLGIKNTDLKKVRWIDMTDAFRSKLQNLRIKRQELETRYTSQNPSIQKIDFEIQAIKRILNEDNKNQDGMIDVRIGRLQLPLVQDAIRISREIKILEAELNDLQRERLIVQKHLYNFPTLNRGLQELIRKKVIMEDLDMNLTQSIQQLLIRSKAKVGGLKMNTPPTVPRTPYSPRLFKTAIISALAGLFVGIGLALLLNLWDNTFQSSYSLKQELHYPVLGVVPRWSDDYTFIKPEEPDSSLSEVYGIVRNNIRFCSKHDDQVSILMASAIQDEGKTLTSQNLAMSFALEGNNVLLLGMDFRSLGNFKNIQKEGFDFDGRGLTDYIRCEIPEEKAVIPSCMSNLWLAPSGTPANNPTPLLKSEKLKDFVAKAHKSFDVIIMDAPAILPVVDATVICSMVESVLLVVKCGSTSTDVVKQAVTRLEHAKAPLAGTMLNCVKHIALDSFYGHSYTYYSNK